MCEPESAKPSEATRCECNSESRDEQLLKIVERLLSILNGLKSAGSGENQNPPPRSKWYDSWPCTVLAIVALIAGFCIGTAFEKRSAFAVSPGHLDLIETNAKFEAISSLVCLIESESGQENLPPLELPPLVRELMGDCVPPAK